MRLYQLQERNMSQNKSVTSNIDKFTWGFEFEIASVLKDDVETNKFYKLIYEKYIKGKKEKFHKKATMLKADEIEPMTGFPIGGVCPFAPKDGVKVYLDESLKKHEFVYPACGSSNSAIKLTISELENIVQFDSWIDVTK
jgi:hypothetical protein